MEEDDLSDFPQEQSAADCGSEGLTALQAIIRALQPLNAVCRRRILQSVVTFLDIKLGAVEVRQVIPSREGGASIGFSEDTSMSPKDFLMEKQPRTDVERVACLAYYLSHYRAVQHFKTLDLSKLNTEAAQPKFANAAYASNNAVKLGYLVPAAKGQRQLSAAGERFVRALPDRDAAKAAMTAIRHHSRRRALRKKPVTE